MRRWGSGAKGGWLEIQHPPPCLCASGGGSGVSRRCSPTTRDGVGRVPAALHAEPAYGSSSPASCPAASAAFRLAVGLAADFGGDHRLRFGCIVRWTCTSFDSLMVIIVYRGVNKGSRREGQIPLGDHYDAQIQRCLRKG